MSIAALQRVSRLRSKADSERHTVAADEIEELTELLEYRQPTAPASPAESAAPLDGGDVRAGAALALAAVARDRPDAVVPAVDGLRQCLTDTHPGLRGNAALALAAVAEAHPEEVRPAVPDLGTLLYEARHATRATVTPAEYPESIQPLVAELRSLRNDERDTARAAGAIALKNIASADPGSVVPVVDSLLTLLDEEKAATRTAAVEALQNVASERPAAIEPAVDDLQDTLDDDDQRVREAAERALAVLDGDSVESAAAEETAQAASNRQQHQRTTTMDSAHEPDLDEGGETLSVSLDPSALRHDDVIGRTATTVVHRVRRPGEDGPDDIAVKHPARHGTLTEETIDGFDHEARQWAGLDDHPNVVSVIDWGYDPLPWLRGDAPVPWIATEVVDGPDLRAVAEDATVEQSLWTAQRLVDAVWHAHHRGVVHLDLKPSNVLFTSGEPDRWPIPKVADWELSRSLLGQGAAVGISTPGYCAPEQDGQGTTDQRTDQFQLGIVLYEARLADMLSTETRLIVGTGFLSSFTTYSTFAVQTASLSPAWAVGNVLANYALGIAGVLAGRAVTRGMIA